MEILICQACGFIIRGKAKFCTGCGTIISNFSTTALQTTGQQRPPLMVSSAPDPMLLERTLAAHQLKELAGGNGHDRTGRQINPSNQPSSLPDALNFQPVAAKQSMPPEAPAVSLSSGNTLDGASAATLSPHPLLPPSFIALDNQPEATAVLASQKATLAAESIPAPAFEPPAAAPKPTILAAPAPVFEPAAQAAIQPAIAPEVVPSGQSAAPGSSETLFPWQPPSAPSTALEPPPLPSANGQKTISSDDLAKLSPAQLPNPNTLDFFAAMLPPPPAIEDPTNQLDTPSSQAEAADQPLPASETVESEVLPETLLDTTQSSKDPDRTIEKSPVKKPPVQEPPQKAPEAKDQAPAPVPGILNLLEGDLKLSGKTVSKKMAALGAAVALFMGFLLLSVLGPAIGGLLGGLGQSQIPSIAGQWNLVYEYSGRQIQGQIAILQQGTQLNGQGRDEGYFVINGTYNPPKIEFNKQYADPNTNQPLGKPILYSGTVTVYKGNRLPDAAGIYIGYIKKGYFYNAYLKEIRGRWDMECIQPSAPGTSSGPVPTVAQNPGSHSPREFQDNLAKIAIGLLVIGFLIVLASLKLFGPSGLVNIWTKKEYIPSQFKSQHFKMLKELGKGPKPGGLPLGKRMDWTILQLDKPRQLDISPDIRSANPHMLVLGAGAKGKTRLLLNFITHDIENNDRAVVVIDSDGVLIDLVMRWIGHHPQGQELSKRVTVIDPAHKGNCPAYNPLRLPDDGDLQAAASAIVFGFKAIYTEPPGSQSQWNQQTANILRNSALLLMANGRTLVDLPTLLADNDFRDVLLDKIEKRKGERAEFITLLDQWGQYKKLARTDQWITWVEPILNRVQPMLGDPRIRPILTKSKGDLNLKDLIANGNVLLVRIPQGQLDQNANLLGSLLVTGVKQAALSLSNAKSKRHPCALYLDEFDNFIEKETMDAITSETKKFQIGLVNCIKTLQHLPEDFRNQLTINVGWICVFALAKKDGDLLGPQMFRVDGRKVKHQTIQNIFNRVNTSPQFELISDEEKLNIDRVVGQEERTYFAYRVGTVAGVFHLKAPECKDIDDNDVNWDIVDAVRDHNSAGEEK